MYQRPSRSLTSRSTGLHVLDHLADDLVSRSGTTTASLRSLIGRPTSVGSRFSTASAGGVKRRIRRSLPTMTTGMLDAGEQVHEVVVDLSQLHVAVLELLVDRGQLLVGRLQLLLGRLQLLVGALQLLVAREDLLVGRAQLLVGGVLLLDHRLQVLLRRGQLLRGSLHQLARRPSRAGPPARLRRRGAGCGASLRRRPPGTGRGEQLASVAGQPDRE